MVQLMPVPSHHPLLRTVLTILVLAYPDYPGKEAIIWVSVLTVTRQMQTHLIQSIRPL